MGDKNGMADDGPATAPLVKKAYDLILLTDATSSMGDFIDGLNKSLPEIISLMALTSCFERIGIGAYRDMGDGRVTEWSGWHCAPSCPQKQESVDQETLLAMAAKIWPYGGEDEPEATKTGLAMVYSKMRPEATTIIILYSDALPHFANPGGENYEREKKMLTGTRARFSSADSAFADWAQAAWLLREGPKRGVVFPILARSRFTQFTSYTFMATVTGGNALMLDDVSANKISELTVGLLLTWMRLGKTMKGNNKVIAGARLYRSVAGIRKVTSENSRAISSYIVFGFNPPNKSPALVNSTEANVSLASFAHVVKARGPSLAPLASRYRKDFIYQEMALDQLQQIIEYNVAIISINPVFGSLWRTVCADRKNAKRNELVKLFSQKIEKISDQSEKSRMKEWLESSFDYEAEIAELLSQVPESKMFPQVYVDPTETFLDAAGDDQEDDADGASPFKFTRAELLEIGRSCDYRILRRLGKALTRMCYAETAADVPSHIQAASIHEVPRIPMALVETEFKCEFWNILLHILVPGTRLANRGAAVLAALALRMGISPLRRAANAILLTRRDEWNDFETPENWSTGCLSILLQADQDYENCVASGAILRPTPDSRILTETDRDIFKTLLDYKMLELNLDTNVTAIVAWQPYKEKSVLGPLVRCVGCNLPRSVTIMGSHSTCGICKAVSASRCRCSRCGGLSKDSEWLSANASPDNNEVTKATWVECSISECRGQYVIYNDDLLRGKSKCFYCRHNNKKFGAAPLVECRRCLSRIIWPEEYRPADFDETAYTCSACCSGHRTIVARDTTARQLSRENGSEWLVHNRDAVLPELFSGKSILALASSCDFRSLPEKLSVLPIPEKDLNLAIKNRHIHNPVQLHDALRHWVTSRRVEAGSCGLCFSTVKKSQLHPACGRRGCHQTVCTGCQKSWYGMNKPGGIINTAAVCCPFCRRLPTSAAIQPFAIASLAGLRQALANNGSWIHAWCVHCDTAKEYVERVCAAGAPEDVRAWSCSSCTLHNARDSTAKPCPGCKILTEKAGGCNHMLCRCGVHWCYVCGQKSTLLDIYRHISREHAGIAWNQYLEARGGEVALN